MNARFLIAIIWALGACVTFASAAPQTVESALERLDHAITSTQGPPDPGVLEAAAVLSDALDREGTRTSASELTLGNAYLLGGDPGRAILHYKRGLAIDPSHPRLLDNLKTARASVDPKLPDRGSPELAQRVLVTLNGFVAPTLRWIVGACALGLLSISLSCVVLGVRFPSRRLLVIASASTLLLFLGWEAAERTLDTSRRAVVVLDEGVIARSGPDARAYDPLYDAPLGVGTEGTLVGSRLGWSELVLSNGDNAWVPEASIGRLIPDGSTSVHVRDR